ncbi:MAG: SRPBCC family protein [Bacteroidota bacterium]
MPAIKFSCHKFISQLPKAISGQIADIEKWKEFTGHGFLPGIADARFDPKTPDMVGSKIKVRNTDGSQHVEEILLWEADREILMKLHEFSPPLKGIASHFMEHWHLERVDGGTMVERAFELHPRSIFTQPFLWLISLLFRKAIDKHLDEMAANT